MAGKVWSVPDQNSCHHLFRNFLPETSCSCLINKLAHLRTDNFPLHLLEIFFAINDGRYGIFYSSTKNALSSSASLLKASRLFGFRGKLKRLRHFLAFRFRKKVKVRLTKFSKILCTVKHQLRCA